MISFQIIVGSMLGGSEYVAEACEEVINKKGHQAKVYYQPRLESILAEKTTKKNIWLIITSTHGAGDYPDNILNFVSDLRSCDQDLSSISFMTIGIGDSSYDTFCFAAKNLEKVLLSRSCIKKEDIYTLDMSQDIDPEHLAQLWIEQKLDLL